MQAGRELDKRNAEADLAICDRATEGPWRVWGMDVYAPKPENVEKNSNLAECDRIAITYDAQRGLRTFNADFIAEAREALPYWIKRALEAEEKLKWVSRDAAEMHDDWIESSARATVSSAAYEKLVEALRTIIEESDDFWSRECAAEALNSIEST